MLKFSENPPIVSPAAMVIDTEHGLWWVGHTKARFEKAMAWDLARAGVGYFLPMRERVRISGGKRRHVMKPLLPGYIFFRGDALVRQAALATGRLCTVIAVEGDDQQRQIVKELTFLRKLVESKAPLELYPFAAVGRRCRVTQGIYMGTEGIVVERKKRARLVLQIATLGVGAALDLDLDAVEPIDEDEDRGRAAVSPGVRLVRR